jgi:hypothetical protein
MAGGHERADRRGLRALALRIGRVLDVRAHVHRAVGRAQRGADGELRIGHVRGLHDPLGGLE